MPPGHKQDRNTARSRKALAEGQAKRMTLTAPTPWCEKRRSGITLRMEALA